MRSTLATAAAMLLAAAAGAETLPPGFHQVGYAPSAEAGGLKLGVTFTVWIPPGVKTLRGVIVHQHGCGEGACRGGETAAYDLHWQALARKGDCALLGPSYRQKESDNCALWCDPENGSERAFLAALKDLGAQSGHAELARVPWCLWGHSGGAQWAGSMLLRHPERCVAVWLRSGTPGLVGSDPPAGRRYFPDAALQVPVMCNPGVKERDHERFKRAWSNALAFFLDLRAAGGLAGFAPDPRTGHECGDSRSLAIPFFDACFAVRLPAQAGGAVLRAADPSAAWVAAYPGEVAQPASSFTGDGSKTVWLPNETVARAWMEYVKTGATTDATPPPAPTNVRLGAEGALTWDAVADLESGLAQFIVRRDGADVARVPEKPAGSFGRPLFQRMSYHDTPERPLPEMRWTDPAAKPGAKHAYRIIAVNSAGLASAPSAPAR